MSIVVVCECGKRFRAKDEFAGKRAKCPGCGQILVVTNAEVSDVYPAIEGASENSASRFTPPPLPKDEWHYSKNGKRQGPIPFQTLQHIVVSGELSPTDLVWKEGMGDWQTVRAVPDLNLILNKPLGLKKKGGLNRYVAGGMVFLIFSVVAVFFGKQYLKSTTPPPRPEGPKQHSAATVASSTVLDPTEEFEKLVLEVEKRARKPLDLVSQYLDKPGENSSVNSGKWHRIRVTYAKVRFDIQKTNSLVSPLIGIITVNQKEEDYAKAGEPGKHLFETEDEARRATQVDQDLGPHDTSIKYLWQDHKWVLEKPQFTPHYPFGDTNYWQTGLGYKPL